MSPATVLKMRRIDWYFPEMDTQVHEFLKGEAKVNFVDSPVKPKLTTSKTNNLANTDYESYP